MIGTFNTALSGLRAAETRLSIAANNIANIGSTGHTKTGAVAAGSDAKSPYQPYKATATSVDGGGVVVTPTPVDPASVNMFSPGSPFADRNGLVAYPNISLAEELVELNLATLNYKANAKVIQAESDMLGTLLDSLS